MTDARDKVARADSSSSDSEDADAAPKRKKIEVGERPTEEMVEKMEEKLEAANVDQKRLFLIVFQRFIMILSEHLVRCDTDGRDFDTDWYRWTIGRLQQVFLMVRVDGCRAIFPNHVTNIVHSFRPLAPRASAEVQQHAGDAAVHLRPGFARLGRVPAVCRTAGLSDGSDVEGEPGSTAVALGIFTPSISSNRRLHIFHCVSAMCMRQKRTHTHTRIKHTTISTELNPVCFGQKYI